MQEITLDGQTWTLDKKECLGTGGFGAVYAGLSPEGEPAALKLVPVGPHSDRERLVAPGVSGQKNVLPIWAHGEWNGHYVLAMPRAARSLYERLGELNGKPLSADEAMPILLDILSALNEIGGGHAQEAVVHRDLKPSNVLEYDGEWCVADFGIARYADATTSTNTAKFAHTAPYTSPEQWRGDRTEPRTDIYSWAVIAVEMLTGQLPFPGPSEEEFKEQHLLEEPPALIGISDGLVALLKRCLAKRPAARDTAAELLRRLPTINETPSAPILEGLDRIELREVERRTQDQVREDKAIALQERREDLAKDAANELNGIYSQLWATLYQRMPSIVEEPVDLSTTASSLVTLIKHSDLEMRVRLSESIPGPWHRVRESFDVIAMASIALRLPRKTKGQTGSEYELWYCNPAGDDRYHWYEMAWSFTNARDNNVAWHDPKAMIPSDSYKLLTSADLPWAVAMPLTLVDGTKFTEDWCAIVANAFEGHLPQHWLTLSPRSSPGIFLLTDGER